MYLTEIWNKNIGIGFQLKIVTVARKDGGDFKNTLYYCFCRLVCFFFSNLLTENLIACLVFQ